MGQSTLEIILNFPTSIISLKVFSNFHLLGSENQNLFPWYDSFYSSCFSVMFCFVFHVINIYNSGGIIHEGKESKIISQTEISFLLQCKVC